MKKLIKTTLLSIIIASSLVSCSNTRNDSNQKPLDDFAFYQEIELLNAVNDFSKSVKRQIINYNVVGGGAVSQEINYSLMWASDDHNEFDNDSWKLGKLASDYIDITVTTSKQQIEIIWDSSNPFDTEIELELYSIQDTSVRTSIFIEKESYFKNLQFSADEFFKDASTKYGPVDMFYVTQDGIGLGQTEENEWREASIVFTKDVSTQLVKEYGNFSFGGTTEHIVNPNQEYQLIPIFTGMTQEVEYMTNWLASNAGGGVSRYHQVFYVTQDGYDFSYFNSYLQSVVAWDTSADFVRFELFSPYSYRDDPSSFVDRYEMVYFSRQIPLSFLVYCYDTQEYFWNYSEGISSDLNSIDGIYLAGNRLE